MEIIKKIEQLGTFDGKPSGLVRIADCGEISEDKKKNALESDKGKKKKSGKKAISSDDDSSDARVKKRRRSAVTDKRKKRRKYSSDSSSSDSDSESDSSDSDSYSESDSDSSSSSSDGRRRKKRSTKSKGKHRKNKQKESKKLKRPAKKSKRKSRRKHVVFGKVVEGMEIIKKMEQLGTSDGKPSGLVRIADCGEISEDKKKNALESDKGKKKKSGKKAISSDDDSSDARVKKRRRSAVTDKRKKRRKYSSDSSSSDSDSESDSSDSDSYSESDSDSSSSSSDGRRRKKRSTKSKGKHRKNKQKESKKLKRPAKKSKRKSRRQMSTSTMGPNHERDRSMPHIDIQDLFHKIVADCYPELEEAHSTYFPLKGKARKEYGDYAFFGVIDICRQLREKDPKLFDHTGPIAIANKINEKFESWKCDDDMIKRLSLNDAGILTFSLEGRWIAQRINNMLKDGIDTWAPTIFATNTRGKAVFIFPTNPGMGADIVRAIYIKDALANLCSYSGADVGSGFCDDGARLKADVMVYMTPHRLREYIEKCHITAANEGWLPDDWEGLLTCCGFRTFSGEQPELRDLWNRLEATWSLFPVECKAAGYTCRAFFECAFKFTCLKSHRLAECIFKDEDICDGEFLSLLRTQALASSQVKDSDRNLFKLNVLAGKERELGLHLVEFTEVINRACGAFLPHVLCEYLCDLSKLFKCCYSEVWPSENKLSLCEATKVVMNKCFELLGIALPTQSSDEWTKEFESFFKRKETRATKLHIIPSSEDARNEHPNSRFEIFSMNVSVAHSQFEEGNVTGCVTFVDKCRLADGDGWVMLDKNDDCHVSYFDREWYDAVTIYNGSYIPLGNTSSVRSVPFSSTIEVALLIKATSKNNDQSYLIYNGSGSADLTKFWDDGALNTKCGTIEFNSEDGRILLDFVAIKDAVDTTMELIFKPKFVKDEQLRPSDLQLRLSGSITASYGKDILGDCGFLGEYTAHIFRADPTKNYMREPSYTLPYWLPYSLPLHKSALAVPANGCLRVQANLVDLDTKKRIVDEVELCKSENGVSSWVINCGDKGDFELMVKWVH